jgi:predicted transposase/invertase (TIGR01784 family)
MSYRKKSKIATFVIWIAKRDISIRSLISGGSPLRFKKLFGTEFNKELLIDFLNQVLGERERIQDLTYLNTENLGNTTTDRKAIFDLYCENESGEKFIIELQNVKQQYFKDRSIFYSTFPIQSQAPKGREWDYYLKAVYTVGILNFSFPDQSQQDRYLREVKLIDKETHEIFYNKLTFIYLEMPRFRKEVDDLVLHFDKCRRGAGCMC